MEVLHNLKSLEMFLMSATQGAKFAQIAERNVNSLLISSFSLLHQEKYGKVGLVHVDAHTDMHGPFCGARVHHGSPVLLAIEEDLIDCSRVVQIGLRGTGFGDDWKLPKNTVRHLCSSWIFQNIY